MNARKLFARHFRTIRSTLRDDVETWASLPNGPFNTDPVLEPKLSFLSRNPEGWAVEESETSDGVCSLYVVYVCSAVVTCKKYVDHGPDESHSITPVVGGLTYEVPISFEIDLESGVSNIVDINGIAWQKWANWPN